MSTRQIAVVCYDVTWQHKFAIEKHLLKQILGEAAVIEHIGSTSVTGLAAKPIIDIQIAVADLASVEGKITQLELAGYQAKGENGIAGRLYLQKGGAARSHHLHIFAEGDLNLIRHRAFRDYLRTHKDIAKRYGELKLAAAKACGNDAATYMALKHDFIQDYQALAMAELS